MRDEHPALFNAGSQADHPCREGPDENVPPQFAGDAAADAAAPEPSGDDVLHEPPAPEPSGHDVPHEPPAKRLRGRELFLVPTNFCIQIHTVQC